MPPQDTNMFSLDVSKMKIILFIIILSMGMYYFESKRFQKYETKQQVFLYAISAYQKIIMFYILPYLPSFIASTGCIALF